MKQEYKQLFPIFSYHPEVTYLDSAATTQKPKEVLDAVMDYFEHSCANAHRGSYSWATASAKRIASVREQVANYIQASPHEVVFTSGATESLNLVALCWGLSNLTDGDEIILCQQDHSSMIEPWQRMQSQLKQQQKNIHIHYVNITPEGTVDLVHLKSLISARTRLVGVTHIHNIFGNRNDIEQIRSILPQQTLICLDATQSIAHIPISAASLGVDFIAFAGHKMFAESGIGILWIKEHLHKDIQPLMSGGKGTVDTSVGFYLPTALEVGTSNINGIISLGAALTFILKIGPKEIESMINELTLYAYKKLSELKNIEFLPGIAFDKSLKGYGILSFSLANTRIDDIAERLNARAIFLRTGHYCNLHSHYFDDAIRVSLHIYNTKEDIDLIVDILSEIPLS